VNRVGRLPLFLCTMAIQKNKRPPVSTLFDATAFEKDIRGARDETAPTEEAERKHWNKMRMWTAVIGLAGLALAVRGVVSPTAMILIGVYKFVNFAIIAHHSLHGAWGSRVRGTFAKNIYRRVVDWLDWICPAAWNIEHNKAHHYHLNEDADPDFVQRNTALIRTFPTKVLRYLIVALNMASWKWGYYASNTLKLLHQGRPGAPSKEQFELPLSLFDLAVNLLCFRNFRWHFLLAVDLVFRVMGPNLLVNLLVPTVGGVVTSVAGGDGWQVFNYALLNLAGAEVFTNVHAFSTIVTNHAGADLWHFKDSCLTDTAEFYLRAVLGSAAYHAGSDPVDYLHGFLNYQAEHHAFPALTPLHYQRLHPRFKAVCARHGVPYIQEPVWVRVRKTVDVMVGDGVHKELKGLATEQPEFWSAIDSKAFGG